ncbi:MAG TPA: hypothetical protein VFN11_07605, partial [Ktedonobacterales bacterium]|nr:hypothetical protein [Ktedonobacterales bacterium]
MRSVNIVSLIAQARSRVLAGADAIVSIVTTSAWMRQRIEHTSTRITYACHACHHRLLPLRYRRGQRQEEVIECKQFARAAVKNATPRCADGIPHVYPVLGSCVAVAWLDANLLRKGAPHSWDS